MNFRNKSGMLVFRALFIEYKNRTDEDFTLYTLKREDKTINGTTYPSLYRLYMETEDPTEWTFALAYFESWDHWEKLCEAEWFKPYILKWRNELEIKIRSRALNNIINESKSNSKESFQANKYILDKYAVGEKNERKGRPTKQQIREAADKEAKDLHREAIDMQRLGLN